MNKFYDDSYIKMGLDEGGYVNDKDDTGGETYGGMSRVHNPDLKMWSIIDKLKKEVPNLNTSAGVAALNRKIAAIPAIANEKKAVYKQRYWDTIQLDQLNSKDLAHQIFDMAVNAGVPLAIGLAQELVGMPVTKRYTNDLIDKLKVYGKG